MDNSNIISAYIFGARRVGHGFNIFKYPKMLEKYKEANIVLEVCPISNLVLGYIGDLRSHPAVEYLKRGVSLVLCSDDSQYFENKTLVDDYYAAIMCWNLGLEQLKIISKNAVLYSGLTGSVLDKALDNWNQEWDEWISINVDG